MKEVIYNRYNGKIKKYEKIKGNTYVEVETGTTINIGVGIGEVYLLGKTSKNLIDLIEKGDYVNGEKIIMSAEKSQEWYNSKDVFVTAKGYTFAEDEIETVLTHEQYDKYSYKED